MPFDLLSCAPIEYVLILFAFYNILTQCFHMYDGYTEITHNITVVNTQGMSPEPAVKILKRARKEMVDSLKR